MSVSVSPHSLSMLAQNVMSVAMCTKQIAAHTYFSGGKPEVASEWVVGVLGGLTNFSGS